LILGKMEAMVKYVTTPQCRMQLIQEYFNEKTNTTCGICDICIEAKKKENQSAFEGIRIEVQNVIKNRSITVEQLEEIISPRDAELFVDVVRDMVDEGILEYDNVWRLRLTKQNS
jgi:ATP-dependent DNA helicase RecQ